MTFHFSPCSRLFALAAALALLPALHAEDFQGSTHKVEYDEAPVKYSEATPNDPVAALAAKIERGEVKLSWDDQFGYLPGVLEYFGIARESQMLVFSKTSLQRRLISPTNPRALYFNDDVYIGYIPDAPVMEISAVDPQLGGVFYHLAQEKLRKPKFVRDSDCMSCHAAQRTLGVPGHFVRSVPTDSSGEFDQTNERNDIDHCKPITDRWSGWYVTGQHSNQPHLGNLIGSAAMERALTEPHHLGNLTSLERFFDVKKHLLPTSDIVAMLVHDHQTKMHNYIARLNLEGRQMIHMYGHTRYMSSQVAAFLRYLLFAEEAPIAGPVAGDPAFVAAFTGHGPRDTKGRSLRDLDLQTRLFKHPCSFLIYSTAFDQMVQPLRDLILQKLHAILTGKDDDKTYATLSPADRTAILEILRDTKPNLPDYWKDNPPR